MTAQNRDFTGHWKRFFWIIGLFFALLFLLYFRFALSRQSSEVSPKPIPVRVLPVAGEDVGLYDRVIGKVEGEQSVKVLSGAAGFVVEIPKSRGESVERGEVIVVLKDSARLYELRQARGIFSSAKSDLDEADRKYLQYKRLFDKGIVSKDDLDSFRNARAKAEAQLEASEAAYSKAKWYYDRLKIRSPLSGEIVEIFPDRGQEVSSGQTVARIFGGRQSSVVASVDSSIAKRTKRGAKVIVEYETPSGEKTAPGVVTGVSRETDPGSTTYSVEVSVNENPRDGSLWAGEFVTLKIQSGSLFEVARVPITAFFYENRKPYVFVVINGKSRRVYIKDGLKRIDSETVAVSASQFPPGSRIVTEGGSRLQDGLAVRVLKDR